MVTRFLVLYDIADPDRLRQVHKVARAFGQRVQDSVYEALLTPKDRVKLEGLLRARMHQGQDQVLFIDLGDASEPSVPMISALGIPYVPRKGGAVII